MLHFAQILTNECVRATVIYKDGESLRGLMSEDESDSKAEAAEPEKPKKKPVEIELGGSMRYN